MAVQRIYNRGGERKCLRCNWIIEPWQLKDDTHYTCGRCGQIHLVSKHPLDHRVILTKKEYAWMHKRYKENTEEALIREQEKLKSLLLEKDSEIRVLKKRIDRLIGLEG